MNQAQRRCKAFLQENGIDVELVERLKHEDLADRLQYLDDLKQISVLLNNLISSKDGKYAFWFHMCVM